MIQKCRIIVTWLYIRLFGKCAIIDDKSYNKILYRLRNGKKANIDSPQTFSEHVMARKVLLDEYDLSVYTDKYEARKYVSATIGEEYLTQNFGVWEDPEQIDFSMLPSSYVLKATHGSGWNMVVKDSSQINPQKVVSRLKSFLKKNYYYFSREKNYRNIQPRIICEEYIQNLPGVSLVDFKVFCFRGKAKFYSVTYEENGKSHNGLFYASHEPIAIQSNFLPVDDGYFAANRDKMITLAEKLAAPFDFVRVDFYVFGENALFSELTFHSGGGLVPYAPQEIDLALGRYFEE